MFATVATDRARAVAIPCKSPFTSVSCALFIATSVPVPIRDSHVGTCQRRGVVDAVTGHRDAAALRLQLGHEFELVGRIDLAVDLVDAQALADPPAPWSGHRRWPSPRRSPAARSDANASAVVAFTGSDTASRPASRASTARCMTLAPCARSASAWEASGVTAMPSCAIKAVLPSASALPPMVPRTPMPDSESNCSGLSSVSPRSRAAATMAAAQRVLAALVQAGRPGAAPHLQWSGIRQSPAQNSGVLL